MSFKISRTLDEALRQIEVLSNLERGLEEIKPKYQPLVAELMIVRLFSTWEQSISEIATKLACGGEYLNGRTPVLMTNRARSLVSAKDLFTSFGRERRSNPNWSKASYVTSTVSKVIAAPEPFLVHVQNNGGYINEVRVVRNFAAHRNVSARSQFKELVRQKLGADMRFGAGHLLITPRVTPSLMKQYLATMRVVLRDICSGN